MSDMQCNSSSCITILAMAIHVVHALIIAKTWSSSVTRLNVLSDRWDEVFWGGIIHLDCMILGRLVRKKKLHNSSCVSIICLHTIDHRDTSLLVVWQHRFSPTLLQRTVTSSHVPTLKSCVVPLSVKQRQIERYLNWCVSVSTEKKQQVY